MPAPITVIVPTLNAAHLLGETTDALLPGLTDGLITELILTDGGSNDDIQTVAKELGARLVTGTPGRGAQLARGIEAARSPWLLLLHADTHLSDDWAKAAVHHMNTAPDKAGHFRLAFRASGGWPRITAAGANLRSRLFGLPYGDQGLLIQQSTLSQIGGMPSLPLMEDVALARRLKGRLIQLNATAYTSAERYIQDGWLARTTANLGTLARYLAGQDPEQLIARYRGKTHK